MIYSGKNIILLLVLLMAVLVLYGNTADNDFMWDDRFLIEENSLLRAPLWSFQPFKQDIVNSAFTHTVYYRPLQILSYAMDYRIWGLDPTGFHVTNILLHFINAVLLFYFVLMLTKDKSISFLTSFLFVVHPAFQGVVAYVSGRADLLCFMFGFLFLLSEVRFRSSGKPVFLAAATIFLMFSFFSKEYGLIFAVIFLIFDIIMTGRGDGRGKLCHIINFAMGAGYALLYRYLTWDKALPEGIVSVASFLRSVLKVFSEAVVTCVFPLNLHMRRALENADIFIIPALFMFFLMLLMFFIFKKDKRILLFSFMLFASAVFPACIVVRSFGVFAEHWIYVPSAGIFLFLSVILVRYFEGSSIAGKISVISIIAASVVFYASTSISQGMYWTGGSFLSDRILNFSPGDASALNFRALAAFEDGREKEAVNISSSQADTPRSLYLRGRLKVASGDIEGAYEDFRRSLEMDKGYENGYLGLAFVAFSKKKTDEGIEYLEKVIDINPRHPEALFLLGMTYSAVGEELKSLQIAIMAYKSDPYGYNTLLNLATAYTRNGYLKEGAESYLKAIDIYPEKPAPYYDLSRIFYLNGNEKEALVWLEKCLKADPSFVPALELVHKLKREHHSVSAENR